MSSKPQPRPRTHPLRKKTDGDSSSSSNSCKSSPKGDVRYDPGLAALICERIVTTPQSMARLCEAPDMPGVATLFRWLRDHPDFRQMYVLAKQAQAELLIDEALDIGDDSSQDLLTDDEGRTTVNRAALARCKMRVTFRQWIAAKLLLRKYGKNPELFLPPQPLPQPSSPPAASPDPSMWGRRPASPSSPTASFGAPFADFSDELLAEVIEHPGGAYGWLLQQDEELNRQFIAAESNPPAPNQR